MIAFTGNQLEMLNEIFFDKERQLILLSNKLDQLKSQLHDLRLSRIQSIQLNTSTLTNSFSLDSLKEQVNSDEENLSIRSNSNDLSLIPQTVEIRDESFISDSGSDDSLDEDLQSEISFSPIPSNNLKSLLKSKTTSNHSSRRVTFDPLTLLLDAATRGDYDLLVQSAKQV